VIGSMAGSMVVLQTVVAAEEAREH
jgi:hypothetical protein